MATKPKRVIVKTVQIGVKGTTMDEIAEAAKTVGAPKDAAVSNTGGGLYNPLTNMIDPEYPHSVTFSWTEEI